MGWTDLFKSKSMKLKADPQVRWFGKLPTYADYYSSPTTSWANEFNDWLMKGYELYHKRNSAADKDSRRLSLSSCLIRLPKTEMTVFASIHDYGGDNRGRPFPLCFYVGMPSFQFPGPTSDQLAAATRVLRDLAALRDRLGRFFNSPGRFEDYFGDREIDLNGVGSEEGDDSWHKHAKTIPLADWFADARDALKTREEAVWFRLAAGFGSNIAQHEADAQRETKTFEPTLRFPLAMKFHSTAQVAGWIRWLENRMDVKNRFLSLTISGEPNESAGNLAVIARTVMPDDFLLLTPVADSLAYVDDLCKVEPPKDADSQKTEAPAPPANWADFVDAAGRES